MVLTDSKNGPQSGKFKEVLGSYDPRKKTELVLDVEKVKHWISVGAQPSGTVNNFLIKKGVIRGKKSHVGSDFKKKEAEAPAEQPKGEAAPKAE